MNHKWCNRILNFKLKLASKLILHKLEPSKLLTLNLKRLRSMKFENSRVKADKLTNLCTMPSFRTLDL